MIRSALSSETKKDLESELQMVKARITILEKRVELYSNSGTPLYNIEILKEDIIKNKLYECYINKILMYININGSDPV